MKLYKNVDLCDLESILEKGILSSAECLNYWDNENRANNSTSVVYLFQPVSNLNTFVQYGLVLLEVEVDNAIKTDFIDGDVNKEKYIEYVVDKVLPNQITKIIIPKIFKKVIKDLLSENIFNKIFWCDVYYEEIIKDVCFGSCGSSILKNDDDRINKFVLNCGLNTYQNYLYCYIKVVGIEKIDPFTNEKYISNYNVYYKINFSEYCF